MMILLSKIVVLRVFGVCVRDQVCTMALEDEKISWEF